MAALELLIGGACLAGSIVAGELIRRFGRTMLAESPAEFRTRAEVQDRYAMLNEHAPLRSSFVSLVRAGWTLFFIGFFALLAVAEFELPVLLLTAVLMAVVWASLDFNAIRRDEIAFQEALGVEHRVRSRLDRWQIKGTYRGLHLASWLGWVVGSALIGTGLGTLIG